jgi:hypothetical protein
MTTDGTTPSESVADSGASTGDAAAAGTTPAADAAPAEGAAQVSGVPEAYAEFKLPEGVSLGTDEKAAFESFAKDNNLTQEQAQAFLDQRFEFASQQQAYLEQTGQAWKEQVSKDPVLGDPANQAAAKQALEQFASPELRQMLSETHFGNHPAVVKHFHELGKLLTEGRFVNATTVARKPVSHAERLYGKTN